MKKYIETYYGVKIVELYGRYYTELTGNLDFKTIKEAKHWIRTIYSQVKRNSKWLDRQLGLKVGTSLSVILSN